MTPAPLIMSREEAIGLKDAQTRTGLSASTLRRWNRKYRIGRQSSPWAPIELSYPAIVMLQHADEDALERLRAGNRSDPRVRQYLDICGISG